ncbi:MAG: 50S ribosome-binding GTPase, partial [Gammaproteobacteria bacterium]|nr:50S ribosome-binding GTPase [Gammaproteobacteria bacterium]
MPNYATEDIRNVALVGPGGAGKTTLIDALCAEAGLLKQKGSVDKGNTLCDFLEQEKKHCHSLSSAIVNLDYDGRHINIIDTPGYPDFIGRALAVLPAVETVAVVVRADSGPDIIARRMMDWAKNRGLDRIVIINEIDRPDADLERCLNSVREAFGNECLPINLPANNGASVVDCFFDPNGEATDFSSVTEAHTRIVDQVVEVDEQLMEIYLEQGEALSVEQLHDPFEKALRDNHLVPVCFTSAETSAGVRELLDVVARLMPNPTEGNPPDFFHGPEEDSEALHFAANAQGHVLAHTFKVTIDPFVGRLCAFRIHQGTVTKDSQLFIGESRKPFRVGHLLKIQGGETVEIDVGIPGDICAVAKV